MHFSEEFQSNMLDQFISCDRLTKKFLFCDLCQAYKWKNTAILSVFIVM